VGTLFLTFFGENLEEKTKIKRIHNKVQQVQNKAQQKHKDLTT